MDSGKIIDKLSIARNYLELLAHPETKDQADTFRARALQGIDEAIKLLRGDSNV